MLATHPRTTSAGSPTDQWSRAALVGVFFVHGLLFASWTAHIPQIKDHLGLDNGSLGLVLLGAPLGSVLALVIVGRILPVTGSRLLVRVALVGYCLSGPIVGVSGSLVSFFLAFLLWGFFQGALDVSMNTQAVSVEQRSRRVLMPGFHGSWSVGALAGALIGALAVGLGLPLASQLLLLAVPGLIVVGWLTTRMIPDSQSVRTASGAGLSTDSVRLWQRTIIVLGAIAFADMLCEGAAADWAAVYLRGPLHAAPMVAGFAFAGYALAMVTVRLSGNRLVTRYSGNRLIPALAAIATIGFTTGLLIDRPASVLLAFGLLGAGLACVVPTVLSAAGGVEGIHPGRAVAAVAGCGWAGFVVGPVVVGGVASWTSLRGALFLIPMLTAFVTLATFSSRVLRQP